MQNKQDRIQSTSLDARVVDEPSISEGDLLRREKEGSPSRRNFLGRVGQVGVAVVAATAATQPASAQAQKCDDFNFPLGVEPTDRALNRYTRSYKCRFDAARMSRDRALVYQTPNGDETTYANKIASHTKALPHKATGEVDIDAYETLVRARTNRAPEDFEAIVLGLGRKLTSPQAGLAMDLEGPDSHHVALPPAPRFDSAEEAGEAVELYWMALARDVHFSDYATDPIISRAALDLSRLSDFRGPKENGKVT
ncbi:MAG: twin-arginine translocation signal domain-containing protein, partial [Acidobacteriota bacterium]